MPNKKWGLLNSNRCCKKCMQMNYYRVNTVLILLNKQCNLWLTPSSTPNYSSSRRQPFNCMLSIMQYSSKLSMRWEMQGNTRYCIARKVKNYYKVSTVLILLNKQCKLLLKPDSILHYSSSKHLSFSCMLSIAKYSNKLSMRLLTPSKSHLCTKGKLLSSDYMCCNL
jgi:hypothetical protein